MDWIRIYPEDLEAALNKAQLEHLKAQAFRSDGRDPCTEILAAIVARIRAEIAASGRNCLDTDHSRIPFELKDCAVKLAIEALQVRIPSIEMSAQQSKQADIARQTLLRVASGELPVARPQLAVRTASKKSISAKKNSPTKASRKTLENL